MKAILPYRFGIARAIPFITFFLNPCLSFAAASDTLITVDGLQFQSANFTHTGTSVYTSKTTVKIGFPASSGQNFQALFSIASGCSIDTAAHTFISVGLLQAAVGPVSIPLFLSPRTFNIAQLVGSGFSIQGDTLVALKGGFLQIASLRLNPPANGNNILLQGNLAFPTIPNLILSVSNTDYITIGSNGIGLDSLEVTVKSLFSIDGAAFNPSPITVVYQAPDQFQVFGNAAMLFSKDTSGRYRDTLPIGLGTRKKPGFSINNGQVKNILFDFPKDKFAFHGIALTTDSLTFQYDADSSWYELYGAADLLFSQDSAGIYKDTIATDLGNKVHPAFIIEKGQLREFYLDFPKDKFAFHGISLTTDSLTFRYAADSSWYELYGAADLLFSQDSAGIYKDTIATDLGNKVHPAFIIEKGQLREFYLDFPKDKFAFHGIALTTDSLTFRYDADSSFYALYGAAELLFAKDSSHYADTLEVSLGQSASPGFVIEHGQLRNVDIGITTDFSIKGVTFKAAGLTFLYNAQNDLYEMYGSTSVSFSQETIAVGLGNAQIPGFKIQQGKLQDINLSISADFKIGGLTIEPVGLTFLYDASDDLYEIYGSTEIKIGSDSIDVLLGNPALPGIEIENGVLKDINFGLSGSFSLASLTIAPNSLTFIYIAQQDLYEMYGAVTLSIDGNTVTASMGFPGDPGLVVRHGTLDTLHFILNGQINPFGLDLEPKNLSLAYYNQPNSTEYQLTGGISVPTLWNATADFPGQGITVINGKFVVHDFDLALGHVNLVAFDIDSLAINYGNDSLGVTLDLTFPEGWTVDGSIEIVDGEIDDISLFLGSSVIGIPIGDTGLFLTGLGATVDNIEQPENLLVSGTIDVAYGEPAEALLTASGTFTVDRNELILDGQVELLGGLVGQGDVDMNLNWGQGQYSVQAGWGLYDCTPCIFNFDLSFAIDNRLDVTMLGQASVDVPRQIPIIGGKELGEIDFYFQRRAGEDGQDFAAAWTKLNLIVWHPELGVKYQWSPTEQVSLIGGNGINNIQQSASNPVPNFTDYHAASSVTQPDATHLTMMASWPAGNSSQTLMVTLPDGQQISLTDTTTAHQNGIYLADSLLTDTSATVYVVNPQATGSSVNNYLPIDTGGYTLTLRTPETFSGTEPLNLQYFSGVPRPVLNIKNIQGGFQAANVKYSALTANQTGTRIMFFADTDSVGYNGVAVSGYTDVSINDSLYNIDMSKLLPFPYYIYGIINDGINKPQKTSYFKQAVFVDFEVWGVVINQNNNPLRGWPIKLLKNSVVVDSTLTNPEGTFEFDSIPAGQYQINIVLPAGYQFMGSDSSSFTINVLSKDSSYTFLYQYLKLAAVEGVVFEDTNHNGAYTKGEPLLPAVPVSLAVSGSTDTLTFVTNTQGFYNFFVDPAAGGTNFTLFTPLNNNWYPSLGTNNIISGTLLPQEIDTSNNFGVLAYSKVTGLVFNDLDKSGVLKPADPFIANWQLSLMDSATQVRTHAVTNSAGQYTFPQLRAGTYYLSQTDTSSSHTQTLPVAKITTLHPGNGVVDTVNFGNYVLPPVLSSFSPTSGPLGTVVTIQGSNFSTVPAGNTVWFGATQGSVLTATGTRLTVAVEPGATLEPLSVTTAFNLTAFASIGFDVTSPWQGTVDTMLFGAAQSIANDSIGNEFAVADLNGDGKPDLVVSAANHPFLVYLNKNTGGPVMLSDFQYAGAFGSATVTAVNLDVLDLDADGRPEVVLTNAKGVFVFKNYITNTSLTIASTAFQLQYQNPTVTQSVLRDVNADGKPDLVGLVPNQVQVFQNNAHPGVIDGSLFMLQYKAMIANAQQVVANDLNADRKPDLAVTSGTTPAAVLLLNNIGTPGAPIGPNTFANPVSIPVPGSQNVGLAVGDLSGDGKPDLVLPASNLAVITNHTPVGQIVADSFTVAFSLPTGPQKSPTVLVADLNQDGKADIISGNYNWPIQSLVFYGNAAKSPFNAQSFLAPIPTTNSSFLQNLISKDLNADGRPELLYSSKGQTLSVVILPNQINSPNISVQPQDISIPVTGGGIFWVNASGTALNYQWQMWKPGDTSYVNISPTNILYGGALTDTLYLNGASLAMRGYQYRCYVRGVGVGRWSEPATLDVYQGQWPVISQISPLQGRPGGQLHVYGQRFGATPASNTVYIGSSKAIVIAASPDSLTVLIPPGVAYGQVSVLNDKGLSAVSRSFFDPVYPCGGPIGQTFLAPAQVFVSNEVPLNALTLDLDDDQKPDILTVSQTDGDLSVFENQSTNGHFALGVRQDFPINNPAPQNQSGISTADFSGDGLLDLIITTGNVNLIQNRSKLDSIALQVQLILNTFGINATGSVAADLDLDGRPDLVIIGSGTAYVFRNTTKSATDTIQFVLAQTINYYNGGSPQYFPTVSVGNLNNDARPDLIFSDGGGYLSSAEVYLNQSIPGKMLLQYTQTFNIGQGSYPGNHSNLVIADIDGDGVNEITTAAQQGLIIYRNMGQNGQFNLRQVGVFSGNTFLEQTLIINDLNGDGRPDFATNNYPNPGAWVYQNNSAPGSLAFAPPVLFQISQSNAYQSYGIAMQDMDGDGQTDLLYAGLNEYLAVQLNSGLEIITQPPSDTIFQAETATFTVAATGSTLSYNWQIQQGNSFVNLVDGTNYQGTTTAVLSVVNAPTGFTNNHYRCVITGTGNCNAVVITDTVLLSVLAAPVPVITGISPAAAAPGQTVTISGSNFAVNPVATVVYFGSTKAVVSTISRTAIQVIVPPGNTYAPVSVTNPSGLTGWSPASFITLSPWAGPLISSSFWSAVAFPGAKTGAAIASGDVNHDGLLEVLVADQTSGNVFVYGNTSTPGLLNGQTFAAPVTFPSPPGADDVTIADFDGDGWQDMAVSNARNDSVYVLHNLGQSTPVGRQSFASARSYGLGKNASPSGIQWSDVNGDGKPDLVSACPGNNTVTALQNNSTPGSLAFGGPVPFSAGLSPYDLVMVDMDGDGMPDMGTSDSLTGRVAVLKNVGTPGVNISTGSFGNPAFFNTGAGPIQLAASDLNLDGLPELNSANYGGQSISVLPNLSKMNGGDTLVFGAALTFIVSKAVQQLAIDDLNGDGLPDLVATGNSGTNSYVLQNQVQNKILNATSFGPAQSYSIGAGTGGLILADIDSDGNTDIAVAGSGNMNVLRNSGIRITKQATNKNMSSSQKTGFQVAALGTRLHYQWQVLQGKIFKNLVNNKVYSQVDSSLLFINQISISLNGNQYRCAVQGAGGPVFYSDTVTLRVGPAEWPTIKSIKPTSGTAGTSVQIVGTGFSATPDSNYVTFGGLEATVVQASPTSLRVSAPFGGKDGLVVVANGEELSASSTKQFTYTFNCGGSLTPTSFAPGEPVFNYGENPLATGDINGDRLPDIVLGGNYAIGNFSPFSMLINKIASPGPVDTNSFKSVTINAGIRQSYLSVTDINNDGRQDIAFIDFQGQTPFVVLNNTTNPAVPAFLPGVFIDTFSNAQISNILVQDIDLDGWSDLVMPAADNILLLRRVDGANNQDSLLFDPVVSLPGAMAVAVGDLDGDGKPDIVSNAQRNTLLILQNKSKSGWIDAFSFQPVFADTIGVQLATIRLADVNGNGQLDIIAAAYTPYYNGNLIWIYENKSTIGNIKFAQPVPFAVSPANPLYISAMDVGDLDGNSTPDIAIGTASNLILLPNTSSGGPINQSTYGAPVTSPNWSVNLGQIGPSTTPLLAIRDVDLDGKADITVNSWRQVEVFRNTMFGFQVQPQNTTAAAGNFTQFKAVGGGSGLQYQWQISTDGGNTFNPLTSNATYPAVNNPVLYVTSTTTAMNGYQYQCVITGVCGSKLASVAAVLTVK